MKRHWLRMLIAAAAVAALFGTAQAAQGTGWALGEQGAEDPTLRNTDVNPLYGQEPEGVYHRGRAMKPTKPMSLWYLESVGLSNPTLKSADTNPFYTGVPKRWGERPTTYSDLTGAEPPGDASLKNLDINPLY